MALRYVGLKAGFHTGFFVGGGSKFGARLRANFSHTHLPFSWCIVLFFSTSHTILSLHELVKTSPSTIKPYKIVHRLSKFWGGGGTFAGEGKSLGAPPPPLCMKPWKVM